MIPRMRTLALILLVTVTVTVTGASASAGEVAKPAMTNALPLWPAGVPGTIEDPTQLNHKRAGEIPTLTPYLVAGDTPTALIVVCPGGGYGMRAAHEGEPVARWLNSIGVSAAVLDYRVFPWRHPQPLNDAQRGLRLARSLAAQWKVDPKRIGILGFSAGGHLAGSAACFHDAGDAAASDVVARASCRPDVAILCYPVITFGDQRHNGSMEALLGKQPDPELRRKLSLELSVTAANPPTFLWHTADDKAVPVANAQLFADALTNAKVRVALHIFPEGRHGLGLAESHPTVRQWTTLCAQWLKEVGFR